MNSIRLLLAFFIGATVPSSIRASPVSAAETAVIRYHFAAEAKERAAVILSEMSSIGVREPGRGEWKTRLRRSAAKQTEDIREAVYDFIARNEIDSVFDGLLLPGVHLRKVTEAELRRVFADQEGWESFRKKFATSSLHSLSRVGFSKDGRTAIYFAYVQRDWLKGEGRFRVLRKKQDSWSEDQNVSVGWRVIS
jgi:hypothetical protein